MHRKRTGAQKALQVHRDEAPFRRAPCRERRSLVYDALCSKRIPFVEETHIGSPLHKERALVEETSCKEITAYSEALCTETRPLVHRRSPTQRSSINRGQTLEEEALCAKTEILAEVAPCR